MSFNYRALVAVGAAIAGAGLIPTGVANHVLQMETMTVDREAWMAAHTTLGAVFSLCAVWHVLLNRRALAHHLRAMAGRACPVSREAITALAVIAIMLFVATGHAFHTRP